MSVKLVSIGDINVDFIVSVDSLPEKGEEVHASSFEIHAGGSAANTSVAARRLGMRSGFIGRVGSKFFGHFLKEEFRKEDVDISQLQTDGEMGSGIMFVIVTSDGERTMVCHRRANTRLTPPEMESEYVRKAGYLHVSGYAFLESPQRDAVMKAIRAAEEEDLHVTILAVKIPTFRQATDGLGS